MISLQFAHMRFFLVVLMCDVWFVVCMLGVRVIANWRLAYIIVVTSELGHLICCQCYEACVPSDICNETM